MLEEEEAGEAEVKVDPKVQAARERRYNETKQYIDFLFRQIGSATYRFNIYFETRLNDFTAALLCAETVKTDALIKAAEGKKKKKKKAGETKLPEYRVASFKMINDCAQLLTSSDKLEEAAELINFLDAFGKLKGLVLIASNFLKYLKKAYADEAEQLSNVEYYYNYWVGFTLRMYDYNQLTYPKNLLPPDLSEQTVSCIKWPLAIRTSLYCGVQFLKTASDLSKVQLLTNNWLEVQAVTLPEEFVCMHSIDESLYKRSAARKSFAKKELMFKQMGIPMRGVAPIPEPEGKMPEIDPQSQVYAVPIIFDTILLKFPSSPPFEVKPVKKKKK